VGHRLIGRTSGRVKRSSNGAGGSAGRFSREAREVAHPRFFRSKFKDKPALYLPVKVAHPPTEDIFDAGVTTAGKYSEWRAVQNGAHIMCHIQRQSEPSEFQRRNADNSPNFKKQATNGRYHSC
jgi:hypothetical protein